MTSKDEEVIPDKRVLDIWAFVIILFIFLIGINLGSYFGTPHKIWNPDDDGLFKLNQMMKDDRSTRLALVALTANGRYQLNGLMPEYYEIQIRIVDKQTGKVSFGG